ncbi:MAG: FAD-linked oxidase C-terminal domain-containing protein [Sulfolobales archaeon]|nr:FAD-binding protein [Sulfolobales archaeon]MDW7970028.1 FAD-linked oxidase C-terminal domain-containing protein [Sulfolobales archaeon]
MSSESVIPGLKELIGSDNVITDPEELYTYSFTAYAVVREEPMAIVKVKSTEEVSKVLKFAYEHGIPVVPRGSGTSVIGSSTPSKGSIVIDLRPMRGIKVDVANGVVEAEAGAYVDEVDKECRKYGFMFPVDPASAESATVGGALAMDAGGMRGARYGTMRHVTLGIEVVLPDGQVLALGAPVYKQATGYDLMHLFIGSEGTLGIITRGWFKIVPAPKSVGRVVAYFDNVEDAARGVYELRRRGFTPLILEFMDDIVVKLANKIKGLNFPEKNMVIVDIDAPKDVLNNLLNEVAGVLKASGAADVKFTTDPDEMAKLYAVRKQAYPTFAAAFPFSFMGDLSVPLSALPVIVKKIREVSAKYDVTIGLIGHAGDGNLHPLVGLQSKDEWWTKARPALIEIEGTSIELGGSISGEHGVGIERKDLLLKELKAKNAERVLEIMKGIKKLIDPKGIMNPGKIFD